METRASLHPETLLEHGPRLRDLARQLVGEGRADDLVQETWLRAVERAPGGGTPWSWLGRVLRNLASDERRAESARVARERAVARTEAADDEAARFAQHRELVAAIDRLEGPYRQALLLRYFDGLPPRRIAARLGLPVKTVKTRLNRALALLREELDRTSGGREAWMSALLPLARAARPTWIGAAKAALAANPVLAKAGVLLVVSTGAVLVLTRSRGEPTDVRTLASSAIASEVRASSEAGEPNGNSSSLREPVPANPATASASPSSRTAASAAGLRRGHVLDSNGFGLAGVWVGFPESLEDAPPPVLSGADGLFELPDRVDAVMSRDARFATVFSARLDPAHASPEDERLVVVAPAVTAGGVVRDEQGAVLAGAGVQLTIPPSLRARFGEALHSSYGVTRETATDAQGRFLFEGAPGLASATLTAHWGHASSPGTPVPEYSELELELVLSVPSDPPLGADPLYLVGEVRHANGTLAPGALVALGGATTHADEHGLFELRAPRPRGGGMTFTGGTVLSAGGRVSGSISIGPGAGASAESGPRELVAVLRDEQPASLSPEHGAQGEEVWPPYATLVLGAPPESIAGRVLGADGHPLVGVPVWIEDLSFVASTRDGFLTLEHQMSGMSDQPEDRWFRTSTDDDGHFDLGGLCVRDYTLATMDPTTLEIVRSQPVPAGSAGVELVLDGAELGPVHGRVVDARGAPLSGVELELVRETFHVRKAESVYYGREERSVGRTDADGRFELARVPRLNAKLSLGREGLMGRTLELASLADPLDVEVEMATLAPVQVVFDGVPPGQGKLVFRDAEERPLHLYVVDGGTTWGRDDIDLASSEMFDPATRRTPELRVPDTVRSAVVLAPDGQELARASVTLTGEHTLVHL